MTRRKAKKKIKKELGLRRWPDKDIPPRYVRAMILDYREALEERLDYAVLFGASLQPPVHYNRHLAALRSGTKPREKYTTASLLSEMQSRPLPEYILGMIGRAVHAE